MSRLRCHRRAWKRRQGMPCSSTRSSQPRTRRRKRRKSQSCTRSYRASRTSLGQSRRTKPRSTCKWESCSSSYCSARSLCQRTGRCMSTFLTHCRTPFLHRWTRPGSMSCTIRQDSSSPGRCCRWLPSIRCGRCRYRWDSRCRGRCRFPRPCTGRRVPRRPRYMCTRQSRYGPTSRYPCWSKGCCGRQGTRTGNRLRKRRARIAPSRIQCISTEDHTRCC